MLHSMNLKIEKYEKMVYSNPFEIPQPIVLIWIEDNDNFFEKNKRDGIS